MSFIRYPEAELWSAEFCYYWLCELDYYWILICSKSLQCATLHWVRHGRSQISYVNIIINCSRQVNKNTKSILAMILKASTIVQYSLRFDKYRCPIYTFRFVQIRYIIGNFWNSQFNFFHNMNNGLEDLFTCLAWLDTILNSCSSILCKLQTTVLTLVLFLRSISLFFPSKVYVPAQLAGTFFRNQRDHCYISYWAGKRKSRFGLQG